jgi:pimeloyl-ACP methyl ester carboxylesterase
MRDQHAPTSGTANINGAQIAYDITGTGPALVLIHAGIADRRMWDNQIPAFSHNYQVVRYDLRGFGESTMPPTEYAHHADLAALLDHLSIAQAHVLGISMGGGVATDFTLTHPEAVKSLIRVSAGFPETDISEVLKQAWDNLEAVETSAGQSAVIEPELDLWVDGPNRKPAPERAAIRAKIREMNTAILARSAEHDAAKPVRLTPPTIEPLQATGVQILNIVGEEDVPDIQTSAELLKRSIPTANVVNFPDTAHMVNMERPEEFNQVVLNFLANV